MASSGKNKGNSLDIEDGTGRVGGVLVLSSVTDKTFLIGESDVRRGDTVSLVVDENLNLAILHHTNTTARRVSQLLLFCFAIFSKGGGTYE